MSMRSPRPVFKPSRIMRLVKAGKMPGNIKYGHFQCLACHYFDMVASTESPEFHENGMYTYCVQCRELSMHRIVFPPCVGYPDGFEIDLTGERKKYPLILKQYVKNG